MTPRGREVFIEVEADARVRYRRSEPPPPITYAITLELLVEGSWTTIRLWDNADAVEEHHEHEYTRRGGKRPPTIHSYASTNEAMAAAIRKATSDWQAIAATWQQDD